MPNPTTFRDAQFPIGNFLSLYGLNLSPVSGKFVQRYRMEVEGQSEAKRLVEVKLAGIQRNGSGSKTCSLEVVLAEGRRIEVKRDFDAETLARLIRTLEEI